jgi:hypothetical protein
MTTAISSPIDLGQYSSPLELRDVKIKDVTKILSRVVTADGVWIGNRIYWTL